jgi:type II secretory pathway component GspD/PulD (secretin)
MKETSCRTSGIRPFIALALALVVGLAHASAAGTVAVRSDAGKLWLDSRAAPAPEVFQAIARETGIRFVVDDELRAGPVTLKLEGADIERVMRHLVRELDAVGYGVSYRSVPAGGGKAIEVTIYGARGPSAKGAVYEASPSPLPSILAPNHEELAGKLTATGVPAETIERVVALGAELETARAKITASPHDRGEVPADAAASLDRLLAMGMSMDEAIRSVLIQQEERRVLGEIAAIPGGSRVFQVLRRRSYIDYSE